jgi:hypothetical protein
VVLCREDKAPCKQHVPIFLNLPFLSVYFATFQELLKVETNLAIELSWPLISMNHQLLMFLRLMGTRDLVLSCELVYAPACFTELRVMLLHARSVYWSVETSASAR